MVGLVPATENMTGPRAQRPRDVVRSYGGVTIEVLNTDAEGRLVLSDALGYAATMNPVTEMAAKDAKKRFGHLLDVAQSTPVCVTRKGRAVGVMMSIRQYELLRGAAWEQLMSSMDALDSEAAAAGLTEAGLEALLADES